MISGILRYCFFCIVFTSLASAQFFYFGRNKVQYTDFEWHVLKTEHFDIYYYPEMKDLAERGAFFAEESYRVLEEKFNHSVLNRIPLIFYSSHLHFQQTNITPGFIPEGVGGFFEFLKGRVVIPYMGSMWDFQRVIRHELVHVFMYSKINQVLKNHRKTQDRLPPLWFVEGLAEYWSTPKAQEDVQAEMVMRDAVVSNYLVPLDDIDRIYGSFLMYKEGQSILQFIGERYGEEKILLLMENFWRSTNFEEVFKFTIGKTYKEFDEEWIYAMKKKYYPVLATSDQPSSVSAPLIKDGFNSKPVFYKREGQGEIYFIGNHQGYTNIYRLKLGQPKAKPTVVIEGERTDEFEAFHLFQSKIDISKDGILVFVTKSGETDVLHLYNVKSEKIIQTYRFKDLVVIGSPSWSPDGKKIVFPSVDKSGNSDLYIWDLEKEMLTRLMNDIYDDRDPAWSPTGERIVFSSDRSKYGECGKYNLFEYNVNDGTIRYITYDNQNFYAPAWSQDGKTLVFTVDVDGARNIWMLKVDDSGGFSPVMKKITYFTTAAFDPVWADSSLVFVAFENFQFQIRFIDKAYAIYDSSTIIRRVDGVPLEKPWTPKSFAGSSDTKTFRYRGDYSLDFAQSQIATDPVFGTAGGGFITLSDLLGNEQYYFLVYNTAQSQDEILSSFNIAISRISLQQQANYAYGIFRFSGRRYDLTDPDLFFRERVFGGYFVLSYPISKFRRIETMTSLSNSSKEIIEGITERQALFLSNSVSFTHDNSLWSLSGPIDGSRFKVTLAYTTDIQYSNANYYSFIFDYRHYFRVAKRSAYATRVWFFYNEGQEARRFFMGGSWDLRGYPRLSIRGKKLWLNSHELRFPFLDKLAVQFPFGGVSFVGIRGAVFFDAGGAWDEVYRETLGSIGAGVRLNIGGILVLRYDIGKRLENNFRSLQHDLFQQFFFGWDF